MKKEIPQEVFLKLKILLFKKENLLNKFLKLVDFLIKIIYNILVIKVRELKRAGYTHARGVFAIPLLQSNKSSQTDN